MKLVAALLLASLAVVSASSHVLYTRQSVPAGWTLGPLASGDASVEFTVALKQRNLDILDKWFTEVSDPRHKNYQAFKSVDEITDLVSPPAGDVHRVIEWMHAAGVHHRNIANFGDSLDVKTTVKHAAKLFNTKFHTYQHKETGAKIVRQYGSYSVPAEIKDLIDMITGLASFPVPHLRVQRGGSNDYGVVPQTVFAQYKVSQQARELIKGSRRLSANGVPSQAVIEFEGQNFAPSDLSSFGQGVNENVQTVPQNQIVGQNDPSNPGVESTLDIEMTAGVNLEASNWFWLEGGTGWLYTFATHFVATATVPQVCSISYGWWEGDQCTVAGDECSQLGVDSTGYVIRVNTEFQKIGLRGVSLLSASGDSGANGRTDGDCSVPHLRPSFPASSPYITAVGATELVQTTDLATQPPICGSSGYDCVKSGKEQAVSYAISNFASGGGFSDIAAMPDYQTDAVNAYLNSGVALPGPGYFNKSGRAFPDLAAFGHNLLIVEGGAAQPVGGTSASSPIWAGIIALLNGESIKASGKPLGFLNPFLYQTFAKNPTAFNDITVGDNKCTEDGCSPSCEGYLCAPGWDPVTGLGSPNYPELVKAVQAVHVERRARGF